MSVDSNIASFDAIGYNDTAMLITADLRTNKNSTIYSRNSATKLFVPANKVILLLPFLNLSAFKKFEYLNVILNVSPCRAIIMALSFS